MNTLKSKTTWNGVLAFVIAACGFLATQPGLGISPKTAGWIAVIAGLARFAVGILQTDADAVLVQTAGAPQMVPAHPTPDDPKLAQKVITPTKK